MQFNENENPQTLVIAFPNEKVVASYGPLNTDYKRKALEILLTFLTSYREKRNQGMNFQSWQVDRLDGRKQLHTTVCEVFILEMAMETVTKQVIFDSLLTIDLRHWIASQCLSHNFSRSTPKQIKTKIERITMAPRFKTDSGLYYKCMK